MTPSDHFFEELEGHHDFNVLCNPDAYRRAPSDWGVVITDVIQSTKAIQEGRYKDVNMIGAATLAALDHALGDLSIPFVFGGDGASAVIPMKHMDRVRVELCKLRRMAAEAFDLQLRVGVVPVSELEEKAGPLYIAKYLLPNDVPMTLFRGGALAKADQLIKTERDLYEVPVLSDEWVDLSNLSCRWKPFQAKEGKMLALLAYQPEWNESALRKLLQGLENIMKPSIQDANPVKIESMDYRSYSSMLKADSRIQKKFGRRLARYFETTVAFILFKLRLDRLLSKVLHYRRATPGHSDFRKFDDVLRMVLDCTHEQVEQIRELLRKSREETGLCFGTHTSDTAIMTCYVPSLDDGKHIHFIDGGDGGLATAAIELKQQLKELSNLPE